MKRIALSLTVLCFMTTPALSGVPVFNPSNGHYYEVVEITASWPAADADANTKSHLGMPGHLATVTSIDEQAWITNLMVADSPNNHCWIGGYQPDGAAEPGGDWSWVTGEAWSYTSWYSTEPNQYLGNNEDNLFLFAGNDAEGGLWADGQGPQPFWYIVEYEVNPVPTEVTTWGAIKALYDY